MIRPGEIYIAELEEAGRRPVLVVSREPLNRGNAVVVVAFTSARLEERKRLPNCVFFRAGEFGLTSDCVAQCERIASVFIDQLDPSPIGTLDLTSLRSVVNAIGDVIDADCEPV